MLAEAVVAESFPKEFCLYDLSMFLSCVSNLAEPDFEFLDDHILIRSGSSKTRFIYADPSTIKAAPSKKVSVGQIALTFQLSDKVFQTLTKQADTLQLPDVVLEGDGKQLTLIAKDLKNSLASDHSVDVGAKTDRTFSLLLKRSNLHLYPGDYDASISSEKGGIIMLENKNTNVKYWAAFEKGSKFEG
jgi:hypothetical protein